MLRLTLKFVRHGETDENRKKIIQGQLDFKLNALGKQQALVVAKALEHVPFTHAFSSDLSRAQEVDN
jgi:probable phosphoglycerate mutase